AAVDVGLGPVLHVVGAARPDADVRPVHRVTDVAGDRAVRVDVALDAGARLGAQRVGAHDAVVRARTRDGRVHVHSRAARVRRAVVHVVGGIGVVVDDLGGARAVADLLLAV